jgi:hypothetical protein
MRATTRSTITVWILALGLCFPALAQKDERDEEKEKKLGWENSAEVGVVINSGNADTQSIGLKDTLIRHWKISRFRVKFDYTRTDTADDRFVRIDPGFVVDPENPIDPEDVTTTLVEPPIEPDVEKIFLEPRFDSKFAKTRTWNVGASWDRNRDAGILSRYIVFGGLGNIIFDRDDLEFNTSYGLSFTDREEENPDPEKDEQFPGLRLHWDYENDWGKHTRFTNDWTSNINLLDANDWSSNMVSAIAVSMNSRLSIRLTLSWLYNNEPALEDVDLVAFLERIDPDPSVPGDEFYITVEDSDLKVEFGETRVRKERLDTMFSTTIVVNF